MSQPIRNPAGTLLERMREGLGRRTAGILLALLVEALLVLALLTLGTSPGRRKEAERDLLSFNVAPPSEEAPAEHDAPEPRPAERPAPQPAEPAETVPQPVEPEPAPPLPPLIRLSREQIAAVDVAVMPPRPAAPAAASQPKMGPADTGAPGDARPVGTAPNGEPLYAAAWYREPYDTELRGYLSTAHGPGWGLIACRTVSNYRVEDCVEVGEYPEGSKIARAVLAAAWQFRVRPPRLGGRPKIGEWVRIRIDYEQRRQ